MENLGSLSGKLLWLLLVVGLVVVPEQVLAEVAREVAPYRVDMISVVLCVIQFNEK